MEDYKRLPHILVRLGPGIEALIQHAWKIADLDLKITATMESRFIYFVCTPTRVPSSLEVAMTQEIASDCLHGTSAARPLHLRSE